jgi:NAD(P)-dependent dehydrogenase (short-subunit alcohol dehydrogenase family)
VKRVVGLRVAAALGSIGESAVEDAVPEPGVAGLHAQETRPATSSRSMPRVSDVRYAVADDIGGAIAALLGDGNRWVTGQRIEVSGGLHR